MPDKSKKKMVNFQELVRKLFLTAKEGYKSCIQPEPKPLEIPIIEDCKG